LKKSASILNKRTFLKPRFNKRKGLLLRLWTTLLVIQDHHQMLLCPWESVQRAVVGKLLAALQLHNRVFITHGKQRAIVAQIKELLTFGNFEPVVSMERESTAIPVPEKVFEDMRSCGAGVLHVGAEGKYLDKDGHEHAKLNDNVLIEIGAAMALYGKRMILLVEKGVVLPSNLQGLYRCEFEGDKLDYESTMKLLKTFNQFR
jgi:predicted nucleotide-binding protein